MKLAIRLNELDNVATATETLEPGDILVVLSDQGEQVAQLTIKAQVPWPFHKVALVDIMEGEPVLKYGEVIGMASAPIAKGEWAHVHNVESAGLPEKASAGGKR